MLFDAIAPYYRWLEFFLASGVMQRCRTAWLAELPPVTEILLLGEGHGRGLVALRKRFPDAHITCLDASRKMLRQAERALARHELTTDRIEFIHADALQWSPPPAHYDLIVTYFFLDCFRPEQLAQLIPSIAESAKPAAHWLVADFHIPSSGAAHWRNRLIVGLLYRFFRMATRLPACRLTSPDGYLKNAGFKLHRRCEFDLRLCHTDWWQRD